MSAILLGDSGGVDSLRSEECDEQDFGVALDRVPDVGLHVGGHGCRIVMDRQKEDSEESVVVSRVLSVWMSRQAPVVGRDDMRMEDPSLEDQPCIYTSCSPEV
jgi:hypothetical protein